MTTFLELFRQGYDTAQIAEMTNEKEHIIYNMMIRDRVSDRRRKPEKAPLVSYWNGTAQ